MIRPEPPLHNCRCLDCGDEWQEYEPPAICPECFSVNVVEEKR